jgi:hypothetical protein
VIAWLVNYPIDLHWAPRVIEDDDGQWVESDKTRFATFFLRGEQLMCHNHGASRDELKQAFAALVDGAEFLE